MKKLVILTRDKYLCRKIELMLHDEYEMVPDEYDGFAELVIREAELESSAKHARCVVLGVDIQLPFSREMLMAAIDGTPKAPERALLEPGKRCAYLRGERVPFTEVETALFTVLFEASGEFVSRDELIKKVWGEGADGGVLNVYVHYLREKLEMHGEKIIISSRKNGYKIDGKYLSGRGDI